MRVIQGRGLHQVNNDKRYTTLSKVATLALASFIVLNVWALFFAPREAKASSSMSKELHFLKCAQEYTKTSCNFPCPDICIDRYLGGDQVQCLVNCLTHCFADAYVLAGDIPDAFVKCVFGSRPRA